MSKYILFKTNATPPEEVAVKLDQIATVLSSTVGPNTVFALYDANLTGVTTLTISGTLGVGARTNYFVALNDLRVKAGSTSWTNVMTEMRTDISDLAGGNITITAIDTA
jgi:hypothetical protein